MTQQDYNNNAQSTIRTTLSQYPILAEKILDEMYNRLVADGYITVSSFADEIRNYALMTQKREGLKDPFGQEAPGIWEKRLGLVRRTMIEEEFGAHYPQEVFLNIVDSVRSPARDPKSGPVWFNIRNAVIEKIIDQALTLERLPASERAGYEAKQNTARSQLISRLLSTSPEYKDLAMEYFNIHDLVEINRRKIGRGLIGSKAAELMLCNRILHNSEDADIRNAVGNIESIFIGSEEFNDFMLINNLMHWYDQKYKDEDTFIREYPQLREEFMHGDFPREVVDALRGVLKNFNGSPFIVRSSSKLEDNFINPFNNMYRSIPIANQDGPEENLKALLDAIRTIYASVFNPNALIYRRKNGLIEHNEEMAILIQKVPGRSFGPYYFPDISGIGCSRTPFKWSPNSPKDEGFLRLTVGLGTHSTDRTGDDYTHIIELSEPNKRHTTFTSVENKLAQQTLQVMNLKTNRVELMDVQDVLSRNYPPLYLIAQKGDGESFHSMQPGEDTDYYYVTCSNLIRTTDFTRQMRDILHSLEIVYGKPVLVEFTAMLDMADPRDISFKIQVHNCRPMVIPEKMQRPMSALAEDDCRMLFTSDLFVGNGEIRDISYVVYVDPVYYQKVFGKTKLEFCALLSDINRKLKNERFIFVAASRWGTMENHGIPVEYHEICNAKALVELSGVHDPKLSDPFCGTRFFQSLLEAGIYSVITNADKTEDIDMSFFSDSLDLTADWVDVPEKFRNCVRVLSTKDWYGSRSLSLEMDQDHGIVKAYFI